MLRHLYGVQARECPLCGYLGPFRAYGDPPRFDVVCPRCGSHERHRLLGLYLKANPVSGEVIHLAPEPCMAPLVRESATRYRTADLFMPGCDLQLNLEAIDLPDRSVDVFICSHLLEHVDDRKALVELHRCTRPGGKVIIMVPIIEGWKRTYENPEALHSEESRTIHFLQFDHVRLYGADLRDRIRAAGFVLEEFQASPQDCLRYGLLRGETVFIANRER
jgi:SAM-dependent methyltransferase